MISLWNEHDNIVGISKALMKKASRRGILGLDQVLREPFIFWRSFGLYNVSSTKFLSFWIYVSHLSKQLIIALSFCNIQCIPHAFFDLQVWLCQRLSDPLSNFEQLWTHFPRVWTFGVRFNYIAYVASFLMSYLLSHHIQT